MIYFKMDSLIHPNPLSPEKALQATLAALTEQVRRRVLSVDTGEQWKRQKIDDIALMLNGAIAAEGKVGLMMNVPRDNVQQVLSLLPALQNPTVSSLADTGWVDIITVIDETIVRNIIPRLKASGARGIVEYPLNKVIE